MGDTRPNGSGYLDMAARTNSLVTISTMENLCSCFCPTEPLLVEITENPTESASYASCQEDEGPFPMCIRSNAAQTVAGIAISAQS